MNIFKRSPRLLIKNNNKEIQIDSQAEYCCDNVKFSLNIIETDEYVTVRVELLNRNSFRYMPQRISVKLGLDTYMDTYPEWNKKLFPTMLRFEKSHMYGYFMSPCGDVIGICCNSAAAGYSFDYNVLDTGSYGHRIKDVNFDIICCPPLPNRCADSVTYLEAGEKRVLNIYLIPGLKEHNVFKKINLISGIPIIVSEKYTVSRGEKIRYNIITDKKVDTELIAPDGTKARNTDNVGLYTLTVKDEDGYKASASYYVREDYRWYLEKARENAILKPPKATTHCESWYGFFSGYLARKHFPDEKYDCITDAMFDEIMPLIFDFESARPKVIPERIQNISAFISLLVDRFETDGNMKYLMLASMYGDLLMEKQKEDGGYYRNNTHYTCVIYPAKSLMELYHAELRQTDAYFKKQGRKHYESVKKAIDDLAARLDDLETEGEMTFEDGMISCAALQLAYFALELPCSERKKYVEAAEYMIKKHRCLEQNNIPDARMNGASIRYWEAQYDINYKGNMVNSPHGWTAWTLYAKFYLYLLTGKTIYLKEFENGLGACLQLMSTNGDLRWGFICEPHLETKVFVADEEKKIKDAYESVRLSKQGCRGRYVESVISEQYVPMISDWYRVSENNPVVGGYEFCPLFLEDKTIKVDNQGGACDNDVHEIFKCMEETVLHKAFIAEEDDHVLCYGCTVLCNGETVEVLLEKDTEILYSSLNNKKIILNNMKSCRIISVGENSETIIL